ncbi:MAG: hypothetical protein GF317_09380 [Candidatus Lokiarchaeota archaeon]|nr:hypothetical protein [Candidatus Lokiarchaeota archaeon]MBD3199923.1 hypothetical protein [Candidatus Lokiarchaeota archaeon]
MPFVEINYKNIYFDPEVQEMCVSNNFTCPFYEHSWSCPPASPYLEKQIGTYKEFYLVYSKFDMENYLKEQKKKHPKRSELYLKSKLYYSSIHSTELDEEFDKFLSQYDKPYSKRLLLYSGTCNYCNVQDAGNCTYDSGEPCRFPKNRKYSMEAVGIEVIKTVVKLDQDIGYPSKKYTYKFGLACFK